MRYKQLFFKIIKIQESPSAKHFIETLRTELPKWLDINSKNELDRKIQEFAAKFVQGMFKNNFKKTQYLDNVVNEENESKENRFLNCDAIYLTAYSVLSFCLRFRESVISKV